MPRYFFDTMNGGEIVKDDLGLEFDDRDSVRKAAVAALPDMAAEALPDGRTRELAVEVRDETGNRIFRASLSFRSDWLSRPSNDP
jgi:hypothetical protein